MIIRDEATHSLIMFLIKLRVVKSIKYFVDARPIQWTYAGQSYSVHNYVVENIGNL
jgi:hypothetical protein